MKRIPVNLGFLAFATAVVALFILLADRHSARSFSARSPAEARMGAPGAESSLRRATPAAAGSSAENETSAPLGMFCVDVANAIRAAFEGSFLAKRYEECRATGKPCQRELSDALYAAISRGSDTFFAAHPERLSELLEQFGPDRYWNTIEKMLLQSRDPIDRIAALTLVRRTRDLDPRPLPTSAYEGLAARPDPETQLLLQNHDLLPLPDGAPKQEAYDLAADTSATARVRTAAVLALGHDEDAQRLHELAKAAGEEGNGTNPLTVFALPAALGKCGVNCVDTLREFASGSASWQRRMAYASLTYVVDPYLRQRLEREFSALSPISAEQLQAEMAAAGLPVPSG